MVFKLKTLNFVDAFIESSLMVLIPLMLNSRNVNVGSIGLILAASPLVIIFCRMIFASLSDMWGLKKFFVLNAASRALGTLIYVFAINPPGYVLAEGLRGVSSAALWTVNRTATFRQAMEKKKDPALETSRLIGLRLTAFAAGTLIVGFLLNSFSFVTVLAGLTVLGAANIAMAWFLPFKDTKTYDVDLGKFVSQLDFRKKSKTLINTSLVMTLSMFTSTILLSLALPLFLDKQAFTYAQIGIILALYRLFDGVTIFAFLKSKQKLHLLNVLAGIIFFAALVALPFGNHVTLPILITMMGLSVGIGDIIWEKLVFNATGRSKMMNSDMGVIHFPTYIIGFFSLAVGGFMIQAFGYPVVFALAGIAYIGYCILAYFILKPKDSRQIQRHGA